MRSTDVAFWNDYEGIVLNELSVTSDNPSVATGCVDVASIGVGDGTQIHIFAREVGGSAKLSLLNCSTLLPTR